jgi:hypothetical protein
MVVEIGEATKRGEVMAKLIKPSDLRKQADELIAAGKMPEQDAVLKAVAETRAKYQPKIVNAREESQDKIVHDRDLDLENDIVLAKMIQVGATLDLPTYIQFAFFGDPPDGIEQDGEFLASVPDVILDGPKKVQ